MKSTVISLDRSYG